MDASSTSAPTLREQIREAGLRATRPRLAVLSFLTGHGAPRSHAEVLDALGPHDWDRATISRNLADLESAGLLRRIDVGDHIWRYEAIDKAPHHRAHFVCIDCGEVQCLPNIDLHASSESSLPQSVLQHDVEIQLRGQCDKCG